jgi:DNA-directed RNA polymerase subunit F
MATEQDTLQDTLNEVVEPSSIVEDAFAFPMQNTEDSETEADNPSDTVFTDEKTQPSEETPVKEEVETPTSNENDERRYQYWQSQADKLKNENEALKRQQVTAPQQQPQEPVQQTKQEEFPPPPSKPVKPSGFSREEAYTDPTSDSAKYLDNIEQWRDNMDEYRDLRVQYDNAIVQERLDAEDERRRQIEIQRQQHDAAMAQQREAYEHVQGHYGLNPEDAREFVETMSKPESLTMDNLVALYRIQKGQAPASSGQPAPTQPSQAFQQAKNAQQVPSPMGVQPSGNNEAEGGNEVDQIMDNLISDYKSRNPF